MARDAVGETAGKHVLERVSILGSYRAASLLLCDSEDDSIRDCLIDNAQPPPAAAVYLSRDNPLKCLSAYSAVAPRSTASICRIFNPRIRAGGAGIVVDDHDFVAIDTPHIASWGPHIHVKATRGSVVGLTIRDLAGYRTPPASLKIEGTEGGTGGGKHSVRGLRWSAHQALGTVAIDVGRVELHNSEFVWHDNDLVIKHPEAMIAPTNVFRGRSGLLSP
jgi:hypothetical protein